MKNNTFMDLFTGNTGKNKVSVRKTTSKQVKYYQDLCIQRNITPQDTTNLSYDELSLKIKELTSFFPASKTQISLINDKVISLKAILDKMNFTEEQIVKFEETKDNLVYCIIAGILRNNLNITSITSTLTGGREGTASKLIEGIIDIEKHFNNILPPTESQVKMILSMYFCPDVDYIGHGLKLKVDLGNNMWRRVTPSELTEQVNTVFTKKSASEFIDKYNSAYAEWKKTRIRPEQIRYIKELEGHLSSDSKLSEVKQATDMEGNVIDLVSDKIEYIKGKAYVPHTDEQLIQMSVEQASAFINQLQSEKIIKEEKQYVIDTDIEYGTKTELEAIQREFKLLDDLMFSLEAMAGYADETLHSSINITMVEDVESNREGAMYIRSFISDMIQNGATNYMNILEIASRSVTLQQILLNM